MKCDDVREDLEAFALGALDATLGRRIEMHLRTCHDCGQLVRAYRTAVEHLALAVPFYRASPRLKERVMGGIGALSAPAAARTFLRSRWWAASAAAVVVGLAIGGLVWAVVLSSEVTRLRTDSRQLREDNQRLEELTQLDAEQRTALLRLQADLNSARTEQGRMSRTLEEQSTLIVLALDPDLIPTELQGTALAPQSHCSYVWSSKQSVGALTCKDLPSTAFTLTYELWATKGDKTVPLGTFLPRVDGAAALLVKFPPDTPGAISNMWVTLEQLNTTRSRPSNEVVLNPAPVQQAAR